MLIARFPAKIVTFSMHTPKFLPDPDDSPGRDVVIYDGNCHLCAGGVKRIASIDRWTSVFLSPSRLSFLSLHDPRVLDRYPDLTYERLMEEMVVIDRQGNRYGGSDAVRYFTRRLPPLWPLMPLLHLPGSAWLWRRLYRLLATNRYRWNRNSCTEGSCAIHFGPGKTTQPANDHRGSSAREPNGNTPA